MKVKLSDRATQELVALFESQAVGGNITHFLNQLISSHYEQTNKNHIPQIEDHYGHSANPHLPALQ